MTIDQVLQRGMSVRHQNVHIMDWCIHVSGPKASVNSHLSQPNNYLFRIKLPNFNVAKNLTHKNILTDISPIFFISWPENGQKWQKYTQFYGFLVPINSNMA